jgi:hypothetical protein
VCIDFQQGQRTADKAALLAAIAGKNRGLLATEAEQVQILQLVAQLETRNPTPKSSEAVNLLAGNWRLLYTTSDELLGIDRYPLLQLGEVYQCIRPENATVYNIAEILGLGGLVSVAARFQGTSPQRLTVKFDRFVVGVRRWLGYQNPDQWIEQLQTAKRFPPLDFKLDPGDRQGWIDVTYLDQNLRISRGNKDSVFVLAKP